jgi:hypothetical protein
MNNINEQLKWPLLRKISEQIKMRHRSLLYSPLEKKIWLQFRTQLWIQLYSQLKNNL